MSDVRRIVALIIAVVGLGIAIFGVVRGLSAGGPARGIRMTVSIEPPVDASALSIAQQTVAARVEERGLVTRVVPAGDRLVVELGGADGDVAAQIAAVIERTANLAIVDANTQEPAVVARDIRGAEVSRGGVAIEIGKHAIKPGTSLTFVLDGKVRGTYPIDAVTATNIHITAPLDTAMDLVAMIHAGATHPLHVVKQDAFSRATGFLPRAWLFLVIGGVLVAAAAVLALARRRR